MLSKEQELFFKDSKIRNDKDELIVVYHGSGTNIKSFDNRFTGQGNDQYGSGFYFTTDIDTAESYTTHRINKNIEKLGGEDNPTIIKAYLNIKNPLLTNGKIETNLSNIKIPNDKILDIIKDLPSLYDMPDTEDCINPLGDYFDEFWYRDFSAKEDFDDLIERLVEKYYMDSSLLDLDILFKDYPIELRRSINKYLGYDGIIIDFGSSEHIVAWFPEQIKSITNVHPKFSNLIDD